jgi:peptidoglycan/xylan/chitin deacetylase (PgdA/CDA1 family)
VSRTTVLAYHAIGECPRAEDRHNLFVTTEDFARQMSFLARRRRVVPLSDIVDGRVARGRPAVAITFDDGYVNVLREAGPILAEHGFPATIFVPTDWQGKVNGWIEPSSCDLLIMEDDELRACEDMGLAIESHGHAHIDMASSPPEEIELDIRTSLDRLEATLGRRPRFLAYPYGRISDLTPQIAERTGLAAAFTIDERHKGRHAFERVQVTPLDNPATFVLKTSGRYLKVRKSRVAAMTYGAVKPVARKLLQRGRS